MQERPNDTWFLIKKFPALVREGLRLVTDAPSVPKLRVDPDGERKSEERRRRHDEWAETKHASGIDDSIPPDMIMKLPPLKTIHLQWLDMSYDPVWRDTDLHVDLETKRMYSVSGIPLLGGGHKGSGALGVVVIASPALLILSPYIVAKNVRWKSRERKEGMSRHAIALMERLEGQLDPETEALLREALRNDWARERKLSRRVTFDEASAVLDVCDLTVRVSVEYAEPPTRHQEFSWRDGDGDQVGYALFTNDWARTCRVLGTTFEGNEAGALSICARTRTEIDLDEDDDVP